MIKSVCEMEEPQPGKLTNTYLQFCLYAVIFIFAACSLLNYLVFTRTVQRWEKSNIPFLHPMFLFGHKYFFNRGKYSGTVVIDQIYRENESHGLVAFFMLMTPIILVRDTKLIQYIFGKNFDKTYQNGLTVLESDVEAQNTLAMTSDKKQWKIGRTLMAPAFSPSKLYGDQEFAKIKRQIDKLLSYAEKAQSNGQPMQVQEAAQNFIVDCVSLWGFGVDIDSFHKKETIYEIAYSVTTPSYGRMLKYLIMIHFPALQAFGMFQFVEPKHKAFMKHLLTQQMAHREESSIKHNDLIDHFMSLKRDKLARAKEEDSNDFMQKNTEGDTRQLVGYGITVLYGSSHTPTMAATYTLHLLSLHPQYQERIKNEIQEAMAKHNVTEFTADVIKDLQFVEQCVLEAERLYPTLAFLIRRCTDDIQIPDTSLTLKKGDRVIVSPYSMHRDPKYFEDPDKFDPERFSPQNRGSISPETFLAFGYGPKKCPAYKQGNFLVVTFVAALLHKYEIQPHSHFKQMDAMDFDPKSVSNHHREHLLVKLLPRKI